MTSHEVAATFIKADWRLDTEWPLVRWNQSFAQFISSEMPQSLFGVQRSYTNEWACLSQDIIDKLVEVLKKSNRWGRDGRSLRQLNKHWCLQLDQHIVEVYPHKSRTIVRADVSSLLKFHNLTSLDVTPFVRRGRKATGIQRLDIVETISLLPKLSHLDLNRDFLSRVTKKDLQRVVGITSVKVSAGDIDAVEIHVLSGLNLRELEVTEDVCNLNLLIGKLTNLEYLSAAICAQSVESELAVLSAVETVDLGVGGSVVSSLFEVSSLVSCAVWWQEQNTIEPLDKMSKLLSLLIVIDQSSVIEGDAFQSVLRRLIHLDLQNDGPVIPLPINLFDEATSLRYLSLTAFSVSGEMFFVETLRKLSSLTLSKCDFCNTPLFPNMSCLTELRCGDNTLTPSELLHRMKLGTSSRLRDLTIYSHGMHSPETSLFERICKMDQLKSLFLLEFNDSGESYFQNTELQQLSQLPNLSQLGISGPAKREDVDNVLEMGWLTTLETLKLTPLSLEKDDRQFLQTKADALRAKAPHLKLEL